MEKYYIEDFIVTINLKKIMLLFKQKVKNVHLSFKFIHRDIVFY